MFIAAFLAAALHVGLGNLEFSMEPVSMPTLSLPGSVSVLLSQGKSADALKTVAASMPAGETGAMPVKQEIMKNPPELPVSPLPAGKLESVFPVQTFSEETAPQPVPEKSSLHHEPATITKSHGTDVFETEEISEHTTAPQEKSSDGAVQAGVIRQAYPRYQFNSPPAYPGLARKRGQEGTVVLQVQVDRQGRVDDLKVEVSSSFSLLDRAALSAVKKWTFEPGRQGNEPISMWVRVPVTFRLK